MAFPCLPHSDAGHSTHPLAGQGMNLGIQDGSALAAAVATGVAVGSPVGAIHTLRQFESDRLSANASMILGADAVKRVFDDSANVTPLSVCHVYRRPRCQLRTGLAAHLSWLFHLCPGQACDDCIRYPIPLQAVITAQAKGQSIW